jgi:hypothetical protein
VAVKEVNINSKVRRVIVVEVGGALALIIATPIAIITVSYCTRFRTTRFCTTSKAVGKGVVVYRRDYFLSSFN